MGYYKHNIMSTDNNINTTNDQETLPLFPVEPTGILEARTESSSLQYPFLTSAENSTTPSSSSEIEQGYGDQPPFFDFFSGNGSCESD